MRSNRVRQLWQAGSPIITGWCSTPDPYTTEVMVRAGFDALVLDMQHGMAIGPDRAAQWLQIVGQTDTTPIVRIPWNEPAYVQWVLDAGAMGVIVPMVNNLDEAKKAIGACRYPPLGYRSSGPNRTRLYNGLDYFDHANSEVICLVMMETVEGIEAINTISELPGLDGYYLGPSDLAVSMGLKPGFDVKDPRHVAAAQKVADVARNRRQIAGIHAGTIEEALRRHQQGYHLIPVCNDIWLLSAGIADNLRQYREGISADHGNS